MNMTIESKPFEARQKELTSAISARESKRDNAVRKLQREIGDAQRSAAKDLAKIESAARSETEALAMRIAMNEWGRLVPLLANVLKSNGARSDCDELQADWRDLEKRSRSLLPLHLGEPLIVATHRLLFATAQVCTLADPDGIDPDCEAFLHHDGDGTGMATVYVPGIFPHNSVVHEHALIQALRDGQLIRIGQCVLNLSQLCERIMKDSTPVPGHWDRKTRWDQIRFGGTPEATKRELLQLKIREDAPRNAAAARASDAHMTSLDIRRKLSAGEHARDLIRSARKNFGALIDPYLHGVPRYDDPDPAQPEAEPAPQEAAE